MRALGNVLLIALQWALVILGLLIVLLAFQSYAFDVRYFSSLPPAVPGGDSYSPPFGKNLAVGVAVGLCAMGVGAILFYLRRLFLARR